MPDKRKNPNPVAGRIVAFITVFCILASLAVVRNGSLFGRDMTELFSASSSAGETADSVAAITYTSGGEIINTTTIGKDILGYGGTVPLLIYISDGRIDSISSLPNAETPKFFNRLAEGGLTRAWNGKTLAEAAELKVDGITGATYSSNAFIGNVRAGVAYAEGAKASGSESPISAAAIAALVIIAAGAILPLFIHRPAYRLVQQLLNVAVLGFWAGTFIDYAMMLNFFSNAPRFTLSFIITLLLLVTGLIYPLFGKPNYYCTWICPFGSLQELAGKVSKRKWHMSPALVKGLDNFRQLLWVVLLALLYIGCGTSWIDYEIFTGFIVESASWIIIAVGLLFVILSIFITRPFCRFVCPTGSILKDA